MGIEVDLSELTVSKFAFILFDIDSSIELVFFSRSIFLCCKQKCPQKFFQGGWQPTYPLSTGSNKTLQLQPGFW